jgi:hypothetical protein
MKRFFQIRVLTTLLSVLAGAQNLHAEDMSMLSAPSLEFIRRLVPAARGTSSSELIQWYELQQALAERERVIKAGRPVPVDHYDQFRLDSYVHGEMIAADATVQEINSRIRALQPRIQNEILRDELMMWYAPAQYLASLGQARDRASSPAQRALIDRHLRYVQAYGWMPQTTLAQITGRTDFERSIDRMHALRSASLVHEGWSETFWPDVAGSLAAPYADPSIVLNFINFLSYGSNRPYLDARPAIHQQVATGQIRPNDAERLARLSAAEKYDLLVGDLEFTFTNRVRQMVQQINDDGQMAPWSGVCDGWSAASLHYLRPERAVRVRGALGHQLTFFPADIKGLASFLWAKSFDRSGKSLDGVDAQGNRIPGEWYSFGAGYQCKRNERDVRGRLLDPTCNDVNPGFFHTAAVNIIGIDQHGFVFDRSHAGNVMNQPAYKYQYRYFRPDNQAETDRLDLAKKRIGTFRDPFRDYRSPRATHVVGVKMTIWYKKEHPQPRASERDFSATDPARDSVPNRTVDRDHSVDLRYDLELDAAGNIVGGEWWFYQDIFRPNMTDDLNDSHPDTIWLVVPGVTMFSTVVEGSVPAWDANNDGQYTERVPEGLVPYARAAAMTMKPPFGANDPVQHDVYRPQPLSNLVYDLVSQARPGRDQVAIRRIPGRYRGTFTWMDDASWARPDAE